MTLQYREATAADVPAMARCRTTDPAAGLADERMAAYLEGTHHPQRALPPRTAYVALDGDAVVGYIAGHLSQRYRCDGEVQYLFVALAHRRTGVAAALLRLQARWFTGHHARRVCVNVAADDAGAQAFYRSQGAHDLQRHWMVWPDIGGVARRAV